jgi:hypothetical protein
MRIRTIRADNPVGVACTFASDSVDTGLKRVSSAHEVNDSDSDAVGPRSGEKRGRIAATSARWTEVCDEENVGNLHFDPSPRAAGEDSTQGGVR